MNQLLKAILLVFVFAIQVCAQENSFDLKSSDVVRDKLMQRAFGISDIGKAGNFSYYLFLPYQPAPNENYIGKMGKYKVGKYDKDLTLLKKEEINLMQEKEKKEKDFEGILLVKQKLVVFSSFQNQKEKKHYLFVQNMNTETLGMEPNIKLAGELDYSGYSKYSRTVFTYELSPDESKILVFYTLLNKDNETLRSGLYVYNSDLSLKWKNDNISPQFSSGVFNYQQFKVNNAGHVYLLGLHYVDRENYFDGAKFKDKGFLSDDTYYTGKPNYTYHLYRYQDGAKKEDLYKLTLANKFIRNLNFSPTDNSVICTGVYSAPETISVLGSFIFTLNVSNSQITNVNTKEFGADLISQELGDAELKRFKRSIDNKEEWDPFEYRIGELKTKKNGDKYFIAEQYIEGTKKQRSGNTIYYSPIYLHKDLYVFTLGADNKFKRIDKVTKNQYMLTTTRFNSYAAIEKNGTLNFIFNTFDAKDGLFKNLEIGDSYLVSLDAKGNQKRSVFRKKDPDLPIPMPGTAITVVDDAIMFGMMSSNMKDYQFQVLSIKN